MSDKFEEGDRVTLTGENIILAGRGAVYGPEHGCVGTIVDIAEDLVWVDWDNGITKMILSSNLSHFTGQEQNSLSPNHAFVIHKRKINGRL